MHLFFKLKAFSAELVSSQPPGLKIGSGSSRGEVRCGQWVRGPRARVALVAPGPRHLRGDQGAGRGRRRVGLQAPPSLGDHLDLAAALAVTSAFWSLRRAVPASPDCERPPGLAWAARSRCLPSGRKCHHRRGDCVAVGLRVSTAALGSPTKTGRGGRRSLRRL